MRLTADPVSLPDTQLVLNEPPAGEPIDSLLSTAEGDSLWERLAYIARNAAPITEYRSPYLEREIKAHYVPFFLLRIQGLRIVDIAAHTGFNPNTVGAVLRSRAGQRLLAAMYAEAGMQTADIASAFQEAAPLAVQTVIAEMMDAEKPEIRLRAAFSILDRAGYGAARKHEIVGEIKHTIVTNPTLDTMRTALEESLLGDEVDADFEILPAVVSRAS